LLPKEKIMTKSWQVKIKNLSEIKIKVEKVNSLMDEINNYKYEFEISQLKSN
jgi:hypothetical protein